MTGFYMTASQKGGTIYQRPCSSHARAQDRPRLQLHQPLRCAASRLVQEDVEITDAIQRETSLKRWPRQWKIDLIEKTNPEWFELFRGIGW
ncbi:GIY-YIG nuclease family protein [Mesorhizobium sp. WSM4935]|uniref:GIY-YIG nuclease family protein n=1 Tax=Mesorhizobium sp. WSM4935 TaxID=3038547 RepID=UPI003FA58F35